MNALERATDIVCFVTVNLCDMQCVSSDMQAEACSSSGVSAAMYGNKPTKPCNLILNVCSKGRRRVVPRSPWISFDELFPLLKAKLEPRAIIALQQLHVDFQVSYESISKILTGSKMLLQRGFG